VQEQLAMMVPQVQRVMSGPREQLGMWVPQELVLQVMLVPRVQPDLWVPPVPRVPQVPLR